jgi:small Trp-rich protein
MWFLIVGVVLLLMYFAGIDPVASWPWWQIGIPFGLAVAWWAWADATGYTKRKVVERENQRKAERIAKQKENLGLGTSSKRK